MKAVDLRIYGIKCDNPECGFHDMSVRMEDYPKWLNRPCPKCGKTLLTRADLRETKRLVRTVKFINFLSRHIEHLTTLMNGIEKQEGKQ